MYIKSVEGTPCINHQYKTKASTTEPPRFFTTRNRYEKTPVFINIKQQKEINIRRLVPLRCLYLSIPHAPQATINNKLVAFSFVIGLSVEARGSALPITTSHKRFHQQSSIACAESIGRAKDSINSLFPY